MSQKIPIETSARHIHLSQEDFQILFGAEAQMHYTKELSQPGQYACQERLTVTGPKGNFEHVIVLGPYRSATQVEISVTDARKLGIPGVIRQSGDIAGTPGCILTGPCGQVELKEGVIVAKRHIHMTPSDAIRCHVSDNENVFVRVSPSFRLAMHVDTDEANAFANEKDPSGVILKLFGGSTYNLQSWAEELQQGIYR